MSAAPLPRERIERRLPPPRASVTHLVDPERRLVVTTIRGSADVETLRTAILAVAQLPGFRADFGQLVDLCGCTEIRATAAEVGMLARLQPARAARRVYVAPAPQVFGMARMYELLRDDGRMRVVRTAEEGRAWLAETGRPVAATATARDALAGQRRRAMGCVL